MFDPKDEELYKKSKDDVFVEGILETCDNVESPSTYDIRSLLAIYAFNSKYRERCAKHIWTWVDYNNTE